MNQNIFQGEELRFYNDYPFLCRFYIGEPGKPLVVFFPGWAHLARISYGIPGSDERDFLAHWILKKGYSFLAVSYPIRHPVFSDVYPGFGLTDWGDAVAAITSAYIEENGLNDDVISVHWSASGQVIRPFNVACGSIGINTRFALALEATPPIVISSDLTRGMKHTDKMLISLKYSHYTLFRDEILEQGDLNGKEIISQGEYVKHILGDIPVGIMGTTNVFTDGTIKEDIVKSFLDKNFFAFTDYPLTVIISGDSALSPYHSIVDRHTWSFINTRMLYHGHIARSLFQNKPLRKSDMRRLTKFVHSLPDRLNSVIPGNHFLFVGRKGARAVAAQLEMFDSEIVKIKTEMSGMLSR